MASLTADQEASLALAGIPGFIPKVPTRIENGMFNDMPRITERDRLNNLVFNRATGEHGPPAFQRPVPEGTLFERLFGIQGKSNGMLDLKIQKALQDAGV